MGRYAWRQTVLLAALSLWLCVWSVFAWHAVQDDAFIHLRYADHLLRFHRITYDGVHSDFGASSLLYVGILSVLRIFTLSPDLPHIVSLLQHVALFAALILIFHRFLSRPAVVARALAVLTLVLVVTPSAVRWFQDGMETGLTTLFCVLLVMIVWRFRQLEVLGAAHFAALFALGFVLVLHRVELGLPVAIAFLLLALGRRRPLLRSALEAAPLLAGAALSAVAIVCTMHALLPDTAIAKSENKHALFGVVYNSGIVLGGAMNIGAGLAVFWVITLIILWRRQRPTLLNVVANSVFPLTILLAGLRGQHVQGARYLIWTFFFSITWNILELGVPEPAENSLAPYGRLPKILMIAFAIVLVLDMPIESYFMHDILIGRAATFRLFQAGHLQEIKDLQGVSYDVGFIGYFSEAPICDLAGIVNGRALASVVETKRVAHCASLHPSFVFGDQDHVGEAAQDLSLRGWRLCGTYEFVNARKVAPHFLLASPAAAGRVCAATGMAAEATPGVLMKFLSPPVATSQP